MQDRNKIKSENEYTYRTNRINCCNNNYIPSLNTVFHLASFPVDEINEGELWQQPPSLIQKEIKMSDDKNNKVVQVDNHYSVTKEAYTILAEKYQDLLQEIAQKVSICTMHFDEAFTKHRHANLIVTE